MKIEPSFPDHWKTKRLMRACGAEAVLGLIRLWGQAKIKRQYSGLDLNPSKLAAVMDYCGDENALWTAMTDPAAPWLDAEDGGTWALHGYEEHQAQIIRLWKIGKKGGRPKTGEPLPSSTPPSLNTNTSSSSSSSPICKPYENHMVSETAVFNTPTLADWIAQCGVAGIDKELAEEIWHDNEGRGIDRYGYWLDYQGNPIRNPIANAKSRASALARRRGINGHGPKLNGHNGHRKVSSVWELKQSIEQTEKEIGRLTGSIANKVYNEDGTSSLRPEVAAKVKQMRAKVAEMRQAMSGMEVAA